MPKEEKKVTKISCDNPACPGTSLKPNQDDGWLFVSTEVYGDPSQQHVFCTYTCLGAAASGNPEVWAGDA